MFAAEGLFERKKIILLRIVFTKVYILGQFSIFCARMDTFQIPSALNM